MKQTIFIALLLLALISCNQDKPAATAQQTPTTPPPAAQAATLPSVPLDLLEKLWKEGTQVDYIFYNYPFTMSLPDTGAIRRAVRHIAEAAAPLKPGCKPAGRVTYQIKGNIELEGDFYFSEGCTYFVFEKNRVKTYANYMTEESVQFFNGQIQQAIKMQQQVQQGANGQ